MQVEHQLEVSESQEWEVLALVVEQVVGGEELAEEEECGDEPCQEVYEDVEW